MQQYQSVIFFAAIVAAFYFLIIRPQKKRQNDQVELMKNLTPGAEILTIGGIYATIVSVDDDRVRIAVADGSELIVAKRAIAQLFVDDDSADSESDSAEDEVEAASIDGDGKTHALSGESSEADPERLEPEADEV